MDRLCLYCAKRFHVSPSRPRVGKGKYCSRLCADSSRIGKPAWNKGRKGLQKANNGSFKIGQGLDNSNVNWKGDGASYVALHQWIRRKLGKPQICIHCGTAEKLQWANKSHKYFRAIEDWISLCRFCHRKYDGQTGEKWAEKIRGSYVR